MLLVYYRTQVQTLPSLVSHQSVALLSWVELLQMIRFVKVLTWISISCNMGLSKFFLPNKTKLKVDQKAYWSFCFDIKVLNKSGYSMPWVHCAFGNIFPQFFSRDCQSCAANEDCNKVVTFNVDLFRCLWYYQTHQKLTYLLICTFRYYSLYSHFLPLWGNQGINLVCDGISA